MLHYNEGFFARCLSAFHREDLLLPVSSVREETPLNEVISYATSHQILRLPVIDANHRLVGVFDILQLMNFQDWNEVDRGRLPVSTFIRQPKLIVFEEQGIEKNYQDLLSRGLSSAYVVNLDGILKGEILLERITSILHLVCEETNRYVHTVISKVQNPVVVLDPLGRVICSNQSADEYIYGRENRDREESQGWLSMDSPLKGLLEQGLGEGEVDLRLGEANFVATTTPLLLQDRLLSTAIVLKEAAEKSKKADEQKQHEELLATLEAVIENSYEGIILIDDRERIILMNNFFLEALGLESSQVIGRPIGDVIPDTPLVESLQTGQTQFGEKWRFGDREFIMMRVPIKREGRIVGAIAKTLFNNMEIAKVFAKKIMRLEEDLAYYKEEFGKISHSRIEFADIIGDNPQMMAAKDLAKRAAETLSTVLILGESGTGKEVFSKAIHEASARKNHPFIKINCAALPDNLLESELFGYAEGAFTGARKGGKPGRFELANKGTIFLDEIGDMSLIMQAKLLRVLQERELERLGGTQTIKVDVRIIAATNRDLHEMVIKHQFRLDLFYRLNVISVELPPLRERREDIDQISKALLRKINQRLGTSIPKISSDSMAIMREYNWPGNIRELENVLERAAIICDNTKIMPKHLSLPGMQAEPRHLKAKSLEESLAETEREIIENALRLVQGNKVMAAKHLGIHRSVLYKKMAKLNIGERLNGDSVVK